MGPPEARAFRWPVSCCLLTYRCWKRPCVFPLAGGIAIGFSVMVMDADEAVKLKREAGHLLVISTLTSAGYIVELFADGLSAAGGGAVIALGGAAMFLALLVAVDAEKVASQSIVAISLFTIACCFLLLLAPVSALLVSLEHGSASSSEVRERIVAAQGVFIALAVLCNGVVAVSKRVKRVVTLAAVLFFVLVLYLAPDGPSNGMATSMGWTTMMAAFVVFITTHRRDGGSLAQRRTMIGDQIRATQLERGQTSTESDMQGALSKIDPAAGAASPRATIGEGAPRGRRCAHAPFTS